MSIFRKEAASNAPSTATPGPYNSPRPPRPAPNSESATVIASGTRIQGEVTGNADLTIDGKVDGQIVLERDVTVRDGGRVKGTIQGRTVRIGGKVIGDVKGVELVEIMASGSLQGNVSAARVVIAEGAFFKGQVEMTGS